MNNNTTGLSQATNTKAGTAEQGALKEIHRGYNKLNGYEAMLHIINRYRFVLIPFIALSIMGSSYSFYNDFIKAFPMLGDTMNLFVAILFSVMLEIVRDGSLIAIFNGKMHLASRLLVIAIFLAVASYMYSSHLKAIAVIEKYAVEYTLAHQDAKTATATNPAYEVAVTELADLKKDLKSKRAEKTTELIANSTSVHISKRQDALSRIAQIDNEVNQFKADIKAKNKEIIGYKNDNINNIKDSQKLISTILLTTLILIESLAMLGAVIKFINKDNADKEVAKHSEIVEEYENVHNQMKKTNDELGLMLSKDVESSGNQNIMFLKAIAENKNMMNQQMTQIMEMMANNNFNNSFSSHQQPTAQLNNGQAPQQQPQQPREPQMGFRPQPQSESLPSGVYIVKYDNDKCYVYKNHIINSRLDYMMELMNAQTQIQNGVVIDGSSSSVPYGDVDNIRNLNDFKNYVDKKEPHGKNKKNKEEMINALYKSGAVQEGEKLAPKSAVVNIKKRQQNQILTDFYKELEQLGVVENRGLGRNGGYYAVADYQTALNKLSEVK